MRAPSLASMLAGGSGDDSYTVYWSGNTVVENPGEGNDSVLVLYLGNYVAPENIENISLWSAISQAGGNLAGNALDNMITGSVGSNRIDGGPGVVTEAEFRHTGGGLRAQLVGERNRRVWAHHRNDRHIRDLAGVGNPLELTGADQ